jgi:hypothetical protein
MGGGHFGYNQKKSLNKHCIVATVRAKHWSQLPIMKLHADYQITTLPINCNTLGYQFIISQNIPTPQRTHLNKFTSYLFHYTLKAVSMLHYSNKHNNRTQMDSSKI